MYSLILRIEFEEEGEKSYPHPTIGKNVSKCEWTGSRRWASL